MDTLSENLHTKRHNAGRVQMSPTKKRQGAILIWRPQTYRIFFTPTPLSRTEFTQPRSFCLLYGVPPPPIHCGRHISMPPKAFDFREFWRGRVIKILPVYYATFAFALILVPLGYGPDESLRDDVEIKIWGSFAALYGVQSWILGGNSMAYWIVWAIF